MFSSQSCETEEGEASDFAERGEPEAASLLNALYGRKQAKTRGHPLLASVVDGSIEVTGASVPEPAGAGSVKDSLWLRHSPVRRA